MPTFTAIALDRLLEHSTESSSSKPPATKLEKKIILKPPRSYILPTLYATPEATPIPDSPSSFPPSPYVINHKRRGPRLSKSYLQGDGLESAQSNGQEKRKENGHEAKEVVEIDVNASHKKNAIGAEILDETSVLNDVDEAGDFLQIIGEDDGTKNGHVGVQDSSRTLCVDGEKEDRVVDCEDFFDPQDSISVASHSELEENCGSGCISKQTPVGEFFDACEELSSEGTSASSPKIPISDIESELCNIRLSLLLEIEKRKQFEEALADMQSKWHRMQQRMSLVGLSCSTSSLATLSSSEDDRIQTEAIDDLCRQVMIARFVANSIGRGCARAEVDEEMESRIDSKNLEIARLRDKVQYYEAVNHEMSQRNQQAVEMTRRHRQTRKRRKKWLWSMVGITIAFGTAAIMWSYIPHAHCREVEQEQQVVDLQMQE